MSQLQVLVFWSQQLGRVPIDMTTIVHQQKQLSLWTRWLHPMRSLRPGRPGVLCISCLASGASRWLFLHSQAPCTLVAADSLPQPSTILSFRLRRPADPYETFCIGCHPHHSPTSSGLDPSVGIPERFIRSLPLTAIW